MPKKIDEEPRACAVRLVTEQQQEYPSLPAACVAVPGSWGLVRSPCVAGCARPREVDAGLRPGVSSEESEEIRKLKAENRRLRGDVAILWAATDSLLRGELDPPRPLITGFMDTMRAEGPPQGLYGRRKMTALVRRTLPEASAGSVDRAMRAPGLGGIRRAKGVRATIPASAQGHDRAPAAPPNPSEPTSPG